jgi:hypothetical protein
VKNNNITHKSRVGVTSTNKNNHKCKRGATSEKEQEQVKGSNNEVEEEH